MYLLQNVDGVEIDVHVRRGAGVADTRRGEIRIVLQLFQNYFFVLPELYLIVMFSKLIVLVSTVARVKCSV